MKNKEVIKHIREVAALSDLPFKVDTTKYINNGTAYKFIDRATKQTVLDNLTLGNAYNNVCSGFIDTYDYTRATFGGI